MKRFVPPAGTGTVAVLPVSVTDPSGAQAVRSSLACKS